MTLSLSRHHPSRRADLDTGNHLRLESVPLSVPLFVERERGEGRTPEDGDGGQPSWVNLRGLSPPDDTHLFPPLGYFPVHLPRSCPSRRQSTHPRRGLGKVARGPFPTLLPHLLDSLHPPPTLEPKSGVFPRPPLLESRSL